MNNVENDFVPYQIALDMKSIGFNEFCLAEIDQIDYIHIKGTKKQPRGSMMYDIIDCPTFSQAFRFFREKYNISSVVAYHKLWKYSYHLYDIKKATTITIRDNYETYEEAELECLKQLIKIVQNE